MTARKGFESLLVQVECPVCGYELDVPVIDIQLEARTFCPNCEKPIQLVDVDASTYRTGEQIDRAMRELKRMFS